MDGHAGVPQRCTMFFFRKHMPPHVVYYYTTAPPWQIWRSLESSWSTQYTEITSSIPLAPTRRTVQDCLGIIRSSFRSVP